MRALAPHDRAIFAQPAFQHRDAALGPEQRERSPRVRVLIARHPDSRVPPPDFAFGGGVADAPLPRDLVLELLEEVVAHAGFRTHVARDRVVAAEGRGAGVRLVFAGDPDAQVGEDEVALDVCGAVEADRAAGYLGVRARP